MYATLQDLIDRFGATELAQLSDRDAGAQINAEVVARALADADAEIDGYLAVRYRVPVVPAPALLVRLAADVARYRLMDERPTEAVRQRYVDAVAQLKALAAGTAQLGVAQQLPQPPVTTSQAVLQRSPQRLIDTTGY